MEARRLRSVSPEGRLSIDSSTATSTPENKLDALRAKPTTRGESSTSEDDEESMTDFTANLEEYVNGDPTLNKADALGRRPLPTPPIQQKLSDDRSDGGSEQEHDLTREVDYGPSDFTTNLERWMRDTIERGVESNDAESEVHDEDRQQRPAGDDVDDEGREKSREESSFVPVDVSTPVLKEGRRFSNESKGSSAPSQAERPASTPQPREKPDQHITREAIEDDRQELKGQISTLLQQVEILHKSALDIQRAKERAEAVAGAQERRLKEKDSELARIQEMVERITEIQDNRIREKDEELGKAKALAEDMGKTHEHNLRAKDEELAKFKEELELAKTEIHEELQKLQEQRSVQPRPSSDEARTQSHGDFEDLQNEVQQLRSQLAQAEAAKQGTGLVNSPKRTRFSLPGNDYEELWHESESKITLLEAELRALKQQTATSRAGDLDSVRHLETTVDGIKVDVNGTQKDIASVKEQAEAWKNEALVRIGALETALESTRQEASSARIEVTSQGAKFASEVKVVSTDLDRSKTETGLKIAALEAEVTSIKYDSTTHIESLKLQIRNIQRDLEETNRLLQSTERDCDENSQLIETQAREIKLLNQTIGKYERESSERQELLDQYKLELKDLTDQLNALKEERLEQSRSPEFQLSVSSIDPTARDDFEEKNQERIDEIEEKNRQFIEDLSRQHDEEVSRLKDLLLKVGEGIKKRESRSDSEHAKEIEVREDQIRSLEDALARSEDALAESEEALARNEKEKASRQGTNIKTRKPKVRFEDESSEEDYDFHGFTSNEDETDMSFAGPLKSRSRDHPKQSNYKSSMKKSNNSKPSNARSSEESDSNSEEDFTRIDFEKIDKSKDKPQRSENESSTIAELRQAVTILSKKLKASQAEVKKAEADYTRLVLEERNAKAEVRETKNINDEINRALERKLAEKWRAKEREWHRRLDVLEKDKREMAKVLMQQWGKMDVGETDPLQKYRYQYVKRTEKGKELREKMRKELES